MLLTSQQPQDSTQDHHDHSSSLSSLKIETDPYHHQIANHTSSLKNNFQASAAGLEREQMNDIDPSTSFQPQYTEAQFNYTSSRDNAMTTETLSTSNPSDILSLLHQSFFTIDDSEASLKLLSYLATQGNLQIFDQDNQPDLPPQHTEFIEKDKEQQQSMTATTPSGFDSNAATTYPDFSLFSNGVSSALDSTQSQNILPSINQNHQLASFENKNLQQTTSTSTFTAVNRPCVGNMLPTNSLLDTPNLINNSFDSFFLNQGHETQQPQLQQQQQPQQQQHPQQQQEQQQLIFVSPDAHFSHSLTNDRNSHQSIPSNISEMTQRYNINNQEITKHEIVQTNYLHNPSTQTMFDASNLHYQ